MITADQAISQLTDAIQAQGKFNLGNILDAVIGVAKNNEGDLQQMLNNLMTKKGVLSSTDEANLNALLAKKEQEKKERQKIRTRNTVITVAVVLAVVGLIYVAVKKKK